MMVVVLYCQKQARFNDLALAAADMAQIATMNQHDTGTINFSDMNFVK